MRDSTALNSMVHEQVWILDDDLHTLEYFSHVLQNHHISCRTFASPSELQFDNATSPACILVDFMLGAHDGLKFASECRKRWPHSAIILISGNASVPVAVEAMRHELDGVLEKPIAETVLVQEVRAGISQYNSRRQSHDEHVDARFKVQRLSDTEFEVLKLLAQGVPNKVIASQLSLALRTIEKHRRALFDKLSVDSAAQATRIWVIANLDK